MSLRGKFTRTANGSGTTDNTACHDTPTKPIPGGNVTAKAYDNAEHPNSSTSQPKSD